MSAKKEWFTSSLDCGGISYQVTTTEKEGVTKNISVDRVVFERFNKDSGIREEVSIHWSECFKWADFDPCGGLGIKAVIWSDGTRTYASGMYYGESHPDAESRLKSGLAEVVAGCYGSAVLKRTKRPLRDEHGFAKR